MVRVKLPESFAANKTTSGLASAESSEFASLRRNGSTLAASLSNWERYYHSEDDPLVRLALVHAQFEFLHPFLDGNGRLGRILIPLFLFEHGLLSQPTFYLSEYMEEHRDAYIGRLNDLCRSRLGWWNWTGFFLEAVTAQAKKNIAKTESILALYEKLKSRFIDITGSKYAVPLLDAVFERQFFQPAQLTWNGNPPTTTTLMTMLRNLQSEGLVKVYRPDAGRRAAIWWVPEITSLFNGNS
jgi:hypothetical protein